MLPLSFFSLFIKRPHLSCGCSVCLNCGWLGNKSALSHESLSFSALPTSFHPCHELCGDWLIRLCQFVSVEVTRINAGLLKKHIKTDVMHHLHQYFSLLFVNNGGISWCILTLQLVLIPFFPLLRAITCCVMRSSVISTQHTTVIESFGVFKTPILEHLFVFTPYMFSLPVGGQLAVWLYQANRLCLRAQSCRSGWRNRWKVQ